MVSSDCDGYDYICRIIGIDPGSTTLGVTVIEYDIRTMSIVRTYSWTLNAGRLKLNELDIETHSERHARIFMLSELLYTTFVKYRPNFIITESPFLKKRFPLAFAVLTEVVYAIRLAVYRYDPFIPLDLVDPPTAKKAVGAKTVKGGNQKEPVHAALKLLQDTLHYDETLSTVTFNNLDEHSIDSMAVSYYKWKTLAEQ